MLGLIAAGVTARNPEIAPSYAWRIIEPLGLREEADIDTLPDRYAQRSIPSELSDAWATTGNMGGEGMNMIWAERPAMSDFFFRDAIRAWIPTEDKMRFYNTRIPMTLLSYNTAGGRDNAQDRLAATFSGNINRRAQIGAMLDYLYSKGCYANQSAKNLSWGFSGSYIGDRYEFQGYFNHFNLVNKENGGITDPLYITDPALVQGGVTSVNPKTIPTNLANAHTRVSGTQVMLNNRYKIGFWQEGEMQEGDTVAPRTYIPVTSLIWTLKYTEGMHMFRDDDAGEISKFFENCYLTPGVTRDVTDYWSLKNTVGVALLEGFHKYAKFGLAAYMTYEISRYNQTLDTTDRVGPESGLTPFPEGIEGIAPSATEHLAHVGAQMTKQRGSVLTYVATAEFGVTGRTAGDLRLRGDVETRFKLLGDTVRLGAFGAFNNEAPPYLMNNYLSNHFIWQNDFGKERTVRFGGALHIGHTGTRVEVEATNAQNHIYFGPDFLPRQHGGSVQVFSARLDQRLNVGVLHWDNTITYQTTSDESVLPLPKLAVYSNLYLKFKIATLYVQLGVDCDYYTKYYAPEYQPATAAFANQTETKIGNYPFMNAYANLKLSKARFYVMMSHVNQGWFNNEYFSMPGYPLNPRRFQLGVSVDFAN